MTRQSIAQRARGVFRGTTIVIVIAVLVGAVLRFVGAWWGLPAPLHTDEHVIIEGAVDLARRGSFEPSSFLRPDHVEIKLSFLAYSAYALLHGASVEQLYQANPAMFILISRLITAVLGTAMIVLAALIGRRFSPAVGAIAAVLFALFPPFVLHSHFATPDIPLALASLGLILALMHYVSKPGYASLLGASAAVSFSIAIKYPGAISAIMIAVIVVVVALRDRRPWRILSHGLTAIVAVVVLLFVISPTLFTNYEAVMSAFERESRTEHAGADGLGWGGNLLFYGGETVAAAGVLVMLLAAIGIVVAIRRRMLVALPIALGVIFWVILSALALHWERWALPMYLAPLLFAAIGAWYGYGFLAQRWPAWRWRRPLAIVVASLVVLNLSAASVATITRLTANDTRLYASGELAELGVTPENSIDEGYSSFVYTRPLFLFDDVRWEGESLVPVDDSTRFLLLSSCVYARFSPAEKYPEEHAVYDAIRAQHELVLSLDTVPERQPTGIEPWDIVTAIGETAALTSGGFTGCDLEVYRVTE